MNNEPAPELIYRLTKDIPTFKGLNFGGLKGDVLMYRSAYRDGTRIIPGELTLIRTIEYTPPNAPPMSELIAQDRQPPKRHLRLL